MRLLNVHSFDFRDFDPAAIPKYAIASHRWYKSEEATLKDILKRRNTGKSGYKKILGFAEYVRDNLPSIDWMWTDTCCIDRDSSQEVSTSVNSMFRWYRNAEICVAYLADVAYVDDVHDFSQSDWFKRGWTLQELVAPHLVVFLNRDWKLLGHKGGNVAKKDEAEMQLGPSLEPTISTITGIPESVLHDYESSKGLSPEAKMQWTIGRQTTVEEDMWYCLLGFFEVTMVAIYGEGGAKAKERLMKKISKATNGFDTGRDSPEIESSQIFTVPFLRDPDFVDRLELRELQTKVLSNRRRIAVVGLGGVGKSQLAIECCYRLQDKSPETRILWIHASNAARFDEGVQKLADDVELPGRKELKADVFQLVHNWLSERKEGKWCLVLDSVDDAEFLFQPPHGQSEGRRARIEYLSVCPLGTIVITTRSREVASSFTDEQDILSIHPMDEEHAVALMEKKLGSQNDAKAVVELTAALDYMPLAIAQAAAYIKRRAPRCSLEQYLATYRKSDESRIKLLNAHSKELRRDREATNAILLTWQISFEHIRESRRSAADLLSLMSFFHHQSIPECLLRSNGSSLNQRQSCDDGSSSNGDADADSQENLAEEEFEDDISTLRDYLFITLLPDGLTFKMHRLVQLAARNWLFSHDQYQEWAKRSLQNLDSLFLEIDRDTRNNLQQCRMFYPHARSTLDLELNDVDASLRCASILCKAASVACDQASYVEAEKLASSSARRRKQVLGDKHRETLESEMELANALHQQGKYEAAEEVLRMTVDICTEALGKDDPVTLKSVSDMATLLLNRGRYEVAESMGRQALEGREKVLGKDHYDTLRSVSDLADTLERQGKYQAAEAMCRRALTGFETTLGKEHFVTTNCVAELAWLLMRQVNYHAAEDMFLRAAQCHQKSLGKEHPITLLTLSDTAVVLSRLGKYAEAETMIREVIQAMKTALGEEHPKTLNSLSRLGVILLAQHKHEAAEEAYRQAFEGQERVLGKEHPHTLMSLTSLGSALRNQRKYQAAKEMHLRALEGSEQVFGKEHPRTLSTLNGLAHVLRDEGNHKDAEKLYHQLISKREKVLGTTNPETLYSIWALGVGLRQQGRYEEAVPLYDRVYIGLLKALGPSHPHTVNCQKQYSALQRQAEVQRLECTARKLGLTEESQKEASMAQVVVVPCQKDQLA